MLSELTDDELVKTYQQTGDNRYFGELYERYYHLALGSARNILNDTAEAEDVTNEVFIKLMKKLPSVGSVESFKSYLYTAVRNAAFTRFGRRRTSREREEAYGDFEKKSADLVENEFFSSLVHEQELKDRAVRDAIRRLNPDQQLCLELFYYKNLSYQQIAEETRFALGMVKSHLQNGKRNLRRDLQRLLRPSS